MWKENIMQRQRRIKKTIKSKSVMDCHICYSGPAFLRFYYFSPSWKTDEDCEKPNSIDG